MTVGCLPDGRGQGRTPPNGVTRRRIGPTPSQQELPSRSSSERDAFPKPTVQQNKARRDPDALVVMRFISEWTCHYRMNMFVRSAITEDGHNGVTRRASPMTADYFKDELADEYITEQLSDPGLHGDEPDFRAVSDEAHHTDDGAGGNMTEDTRRWHRPRGWDSLRTSAPIPQASDATRDGDASSFQVESKGIESEENAGATKETSCEEKFGLLIGPALTIRLGLLVSPILAGQLGLSPAWPWSGA